MNKLDMLVAKYPVHAQSVWTNIKLVTRLHIHPTQAVLMRFMNSAALLGWSRLVPSVMNAHAVDKHSYPWRSVKMLRNLCISKC